MTELYKKVTVDGHDIEIDGTTGDVELDVEYYDQGYASIKTINFTLDELKELVKQAERHIVEYSAYIKSECKGYKVPNIDDTVKVQTGRNKGQFGKVTTIKEANVMVDFGRIMTTPDGFTTPDRYWVHIKNLEIKE